MTPRVDTLVLKEASITPIGTCLSVGIDPSSSFPQEKKRNRLNESKQHSNTCFIEYTIYRLTHLIVLPSGRAQLLSIPALLLPCIALSPLAVFPEGVRDQ